MRSEVDCAKQRLPSLASLPSFCTECGSKAPNSNGHLSRLLINLHKQNNKIPPTRRANGSGHPGRRGGGGDRPRLCDARKSKRALHIDPPASSYAIMRRARLPGCSRRARPHARSKSSSAVELRCGAVAVGRTYLFPPLSSGGALVVQPWLVSTSRSSNRQADFPHPALGQDFTLCFRVQRHL